MEERHKIKSQKQKHVLQEYRSKAEHYICACLNKNDNNITNVRRTPGGLLYTRQWTNMQYVSNAAFLLTLDSDRLTAHDQTVDCPQGPAGPREISEFAESQIDYILGSNPMATSYLVGHGSNYPRKVHHRGASIEAYKKSKGFIGCTQGYDNWYGRSDPNPNVVVGALVGGPDHDDQFRDERWNYMQTEACTYNTAPLVGVFAKLHYRIQLQEAQNYVSLDEPNFIASS